MAVSETSVANLALQKLSAGRITDLAQDVPAATAIKACFDHCRDLELSTHNWRFALSRVVLSPDPTPPAFDYGYAFALPADMLKPLLQHQQSSDWSIENHNGIVSILTNDSTPIKLRYIKRITDPVRWPPYFDEMLACRIAAQTCEEITNSNTKLVNIKEQYKDARLLAKRTNGFITVPIEPPEDDWDIARR